MKRHWTNLIAALVLTWAAQASAQVTIYCCDQAAEDAYLAAVAAQYASAVVVHESFEGGAWASVRSPSFAPSVSDQGLTWAQPNDGLTTNNFDSSDGNYQMFTFDAVTGHTEPDGYTVSGDGVVMYALGGWFAGVGTKIRFIVDGDPARVDFTGPQSTVTDWTFLGFVDTQPFRSIEVVRADEAGNETKIFWSDDFNIATVPASGNGDMNGDGNADILWRNSLTGQNWLYLMNGASITASQGINTVAPPDWQIVGNGDYDGDGNADILWRNGATGQNWLYLMNGASIVASQGVNTVASLDWQIVGDGDYNGDGNADILWRNSSTGQNWLYLMNGASITASQGINTVASPDWQIAADGDFNGDGNADILWRNSSTGQNWLYLMNGASIMASQGVNTVASPDWQIVGNGDYNGDGNADILWRNSSTGQNWLYLMNGASIAASQGVNTVAALDWQVAGDDDYNGDGKADILWRNSATGQNWLYLMNGTAISSSVGVNTVSDTNWTIINTR